MKLAIVGIRGLPNSYGGFETLAEHLVEYLANDIEITVYCSSKDMQTRLPFYKGATLKYVPVSSHGIYGIFYDSISLYRAISKNDKILFLGFGGGFIVPFLKGKRKIILNIGGLDWKRSKWSPLAQKVIKIAERLLINNSGTIVSDNVGIQQYILAKYKRSSELIAYGGDQAASRPATEQYKHEYPFLSRTYAFTVARIQSDNNIELILDAFLMQDALPLVMVGNWSNSAYGIRIKKKYNSEKQLILLDAIYEREKLDVLRSNCSLYIHGHSAGGTNPALTEAMYLGLPVLAFASGYNEYTTEYKAIYFKTAQELATLVSNYKILPLKNIATEMKSIADRKYRWSDIAERYKKIILS